MERITPARREWGYLRWPQEGSVWAAITCQLHVEQAPSLFGDILSSTSHVEKQLDVLTSVTLIVRIDVHLAEIFGLFGKVIIVVTFDRGLATGDEVEMP